MLAQLCAFWSDYTVRTVTLGAALLGVLSGVMGSFCVLGKRSLLGDGISHCALAGVAASFLLLGRKQILALLLGAAVSSMAAVYLMVKIVQCTRKVKFDSALALVMSSFFGIGMMLLTYAQKLPNANQAGLSQFIFGQASAMLREDIDLMILCAGVMIFVVAALFKEFKLLCFDAQFAHSMGFAPHKLNLLLSVMTVLAIVVGLQTVGVVLMSSMLVAPAVAARQWSAHLGGMVLLSAVFGAVGGVAGTVASSIFPKLPTGPAIVVAVSALAIFSILFAPRRGLLARQFRHWRRREQLKAIEARSIGGDR